MTLPASDRASVIPADAWGKASGGTGSGRAGVVVLPGERYPARGMILPVPVAILMLKPG